MDKLKKVFVWAAVAFLLFTMFSIQDAETVMTVLGNGLQNGIDALSGAVD
jgi:hypothetical protein